MRFGLQFFIPRLYNDLKRQFYKCRRGDWWFHKLHLRFYGR